MSTTPNLKNDAEILKMKTKANEIKNLKYRTGKHDYENIIKSLKIDNECNKKKYIPFRKRKFT